MRSGATGLESTKPLNSDGCMEVANKLTSNSIESWLLSYYARAGLFVGDLDGVTGEAAVEKARVELSRTFADIIQSGEFSTKSYVICDTLPNLCRYAISSGFKGFVGTCTC